MYIGQASIGNIYRRFRPYRSQGYGGSAIVGKAVDKYGIEAFSFVIEQQLAADTVLLNNSLKAFLEERETYYILLFKPTGYNASESGSTNQGYKHSEEAKQRLSASWTDERKEAASKNIRKYVSTPEAIQKMAKSLTGKTLSEDVRKKMSETRNRPEYKEMVSKVHKGKVIPDNTRTNHSLRLVYE